MRRFEVAFFFQKSVSRLKRHSRFFWQADFLLLVGPVISWIIETKTFLDEVLEFSRIFLPASVAHQKVFCRQNFSDTPCTQPWSRKLPNCQNVKSKIGIRNFGFKKMLLPVIKLGNFSIYYEVCHSKRNWNFNIFFEGFLMFKICFCGIEVMKS